MKLPCLKLLSFALCLLAVLCILLPGDVSAQQCGANGSVGCGAPAVTSLNAQLANQLAVAPTPTLAPAQASAASSATSGGAAVAAQPLVATQQYVTVPQTVQQTVQLPSVQTAPQVQYVQVPVSVPQVQYVVTQPQPQTIHVAAATLPQVQFATAAPLAVTAPVGASASASASTAVASTALPIVAAQPAAIINTGCSSGSCNRVGLLQAVRRPTSRSKSVSRSITRS